MYYYTSMTSFYKIIISCYLSMTPLDPKTAHCPTKQLVEYELFTDDDDDDDDDVISNNLAPMALSRSNPSCAKLY